MWRAGRLSAAVIMPQTISAVEFRDLGLIPYLEAWEYQEKLFREVIAAKLEPGMKRGQPADHPGNAGIPARDIRENQQGR
jgi:hypothetical protein